MTEGEVIAVFERVVDNMTLYLNDLDDYRNCLRKYEKGRLGKYEREIFSAKEKVDKRQYEEAMAQIARAKYLRQDIDESLDAAKAYDKAKQLIKFFKHEVNSKSLLERMPSILVIEKMLKEAERLMAAKEADYLQAQTLIEFCSIESQKTRAERGEAEELRIKKELIQSIDDLKQVCSDTLAYKDECDSFPIAGSIETTLIKFIEEGELKLVRKFVDDLSFVLKPRRSFRDRLHKYLDLAQQHEKGLRKALKQNGWVGGANFLLTLVNHRFMTQLTETDAKLEEAQRS